MLDIWVFWLLGLFVRILLGVEDLCLVYGVLLKGFYEDLFVFLLSVRGRFMLWLCLVWFLWLGVDGVGLLVLCCRFELISLDFEFGFLGFLKEFCFGLGWLSVIDDLFVLVEGCGDWFMGGWLGLFVLECMFIFLVCDWFFRFKVYEEWWFDLVFFCIGVEGGDELVC